MNEKLTGARRQIALRELHGWAEVEDRDAVRKTFHFSDFSQAWAFMSRVALLAEKSNHYPELFNDFNRVEVILATAEADGLTQRDVDMGRHIEQFAPQHDK